MTEERVGMWDVLRMPRLGGEQLKADFDSRQVLKRKRIPWILLVFSVFLVSIFIGLGWVSQVKAISYPQKIVRIINPVAPGGNQDTIAHAMAEQFTRTFGQAVVVESRPSSSAIVGTRLVKNALADGYTLLCISNTFVRVPALVKDPGYDPIKDFIGISMTGEVPLVLVITPSLPVNSVNQLIDLAKRRPGEIANASSGAGSTGHVASEVFSLRAGIRLLNIQYKGAAPAVIDLVGGHVMMRFDQVTTSLPFIRDKKLRALAVTTLKRSSVLPQVPTIDEIALKGFNDATYNGLLAPAGTPKEVIDILFEAVGRAVSVPDLHRYFMEQGIELMRSASAEAFNSFLKSQVEEFAVIAKKTGMSWR